MGMKILQIFASITFIVVTVTALKQGKSDARITYDDYLMGRLQEANRADINPHSVQLA